MDSDSDSELLNNLLSNTADKETEVSQEAEPQKKSLKELDFNFLDNSPKTDTEKKPSIVEEKSQVYNDALDSSDDEDRRCFEEQKYSEYGRDIKTLLKKETSTKDVDRSLREKSSKTFDFSATKGSTVAASTNNTNVLHASRDVYTDEFFGLRIVNPLVASNDMKVRMNGKVAVTVSKVKYHLNTDYSDKDWVIAGVLINKSPPKTSQKGSLYSIWKLTDLSENMNTVCLFLFSSAYKTFWKTTIGTVVAVLNPNVLESKDFNDLATLSVDNAQKIMILGKSKDMGKCRSTKRNGDPCNSIVNLSHCEFCLFHIKQEYKKCSSRAELQAFSNTQKFSADMLKQKSQQQRKSNYNNMPEFHAVVAVKNKKLEEKDAKRLALLSGSQKTDIVKPKLLEEKIPEEKEKKQFNQMTVSRGWKAAVMSQTPSDDHLGSFSPSLTSRTFKKQNDIEKKDLTKLPSLSTNPRLGAGCLGGTIDLSVPITKKHINSAKTNAIKWVKENGKIKAKDPNKIRLSIEKKIDVGKKRMREDDSREDEQPTKKSNNVLSKEFLELMKVKSAHEDLIEKHEEREQENYFRKLEIKERMEEKMLTTYKVACKAVTCLVCKYTAFSASDICKERRHPLRVNDATKRFFKCGGCGKRTVSLNRIPSHSCIKCGSSNWTKATMMDENKTKASVTALSIRGDEEAHLGSRTTNANLNLLVPDSDNK